LNGNASSSAISVVDPLTNQILANLPAPVEAVSIAVNADGSDVYALEPSGRVSEIAGTSGHLIAAFPTGSSARAMAISPDGATLYVLKGTSVENIAVFTLGTEIQKRVLPAPSSTVGVVIGADGTVLYSLSGTQNVGNVQAFSLAETHQ